MTVCEQPTQAQIDYISKRQDDGWFLVEGPHEWVTDTAGEGIPAGTYLGVVCTFEFRFQDDKFWPQYDEVIIADDGTPIRVH